MNLAIVLSAALAIDYSSALYVKPACDPCSSGCGASPALQNTLNVNFCQGQNEHFQPTRNGSSIFYHKDGGAIMRIARANEAPELASQDYIVYGRVEVHAKGAKGQGIASTIKLVNDNGGTLGFDLIGASAESVKTNWQPRASANTFINILDHKVVQPLELYHNYTIEWTKTGTTWYIDSVAVRYLPALGHEGYPCLPMNLRLDLNAAGNAAQFSHEYIRWVGGIVDFNHSPFDFGIRLVKIDNYSSGTQYAYRDQNCNADSIQALNGVIADETNGIGFIADKPTKINTANYNQDSDSSANQAVFSNKLALGEDVNNDEKSKSTNVKSLAQDLYQKHMPNNTKTTKSVKNIASTSALPLALIAAVVCVVAVPAMLGLVGEL